MIAPRVKGIRKAPKPRMGVSMAPAVRIYLDDEAESRVATEAAIAAAGEWSYEGLMLAKPRGANEGGPALQDRLVGLQNRCYLAATEAVLKLRDPDFETTPERLRRIADETAARESALARLRAACRLLPTHTIRFLAETAEINVEKSEGGGS